MPQRARAEASATASRPWRRRRSLIVVTARWGPGIRLQIQSPRARFQGRRAGCRQRSARADDLPQETVPRLLGQRDRWGDSAAWGLPSDRSSDEDVEVELLSEQISACENQ